FEIASHFGRRISPKVVLRHTIQHVWEPSNPNKGIAVISLALRNEGLAYAWHPAVWIDRPIDSRFEWERNPRGISNELMRSMTLLSHPNREGCGMLERTPLFPGSAVDFERIRTTFRRPFRADADLEFQFRIVAESMPASIGTYKVSWAEIADA